jgi:hypothetical protein
MQIFSNFIGYFSNFIGYFSDFIGENVKKITFLNVFMLLFCHENKKIY